MPMSGVGVGKIFSGGGPNVHLLRVFMQMTRRQNFDATPGTDWTVISMLSTGCHVKFDASVKNLTPPCLFENPFWCG